MIRQWKGKVGLAWEGAMCDVAGISWLWEGQVRDIVRRAMVLSQHCFQRIALKVWMPLEPYRILIIPWLSSAQGLSFLW